MLKPLPEIELLIAATSSVLSAEVGLASGIERVTSPDASARFAARFIDAAQRHRIAQLLAPYGAGLGLSSEIIVGLRESARQAKLSAMASVADTIQVSMALNDVGISHLIIKGVALSQQTTGSPVGRGPGDVDVLVSPTDVEAVVRALVEAGLRRRRTGFPAPDAALFPTAQRVQKELLLWCGDREVDLHWRLDNPRASLHWEFEELAGSAERVAINGLEVATLGPLHATIFSACHGATDAWTQLRALVDHVRLARGQAADTLLARAREVGAGQRVQLASALAARLLGTAPPPMRRSTSTVADRMWAWLLAGEDFSGRVTPKAAGRGFATDLVLYDSPRQAAQRVSALAWPVGAMATQSLGAPGDRLPRLYALAFPYFFTKRVLGRWT